MPPPFSLLPKPHPYLQTPPTSPDDLSPKLLPFTLEHVVVQTAVSHTPSQRQGEPQTHAARHTAPLDMGQFFSWIRGERDQTGLQDVAVEQQVSLTGYNPIEVSESRACAWVVLALCKLKSKHVWYAEMSIVNVCFYNVGICWVVFKLWSRGLGCGSSSQQPSVGGRRAGMFEECWEMHFLKIVNSSLNAFCSFTAFLAVYSCVAMCDGFLMSPLIASLGVFVKQWWIIAHIMIAGWMMFLESIEP